jgi:curved DNA-binding protein CbpA
MTERASEDYYEILQLSPNAEQLVITKVYRLLAAYYHPDNKQTGNEERFKRVLKAYEVLSDPAKRSRYNLEFLGRDALHPRTPSNEQQKSGVARSREELKAKFGATAKGEGSADANFSERELRKQMLMALYDVRRNTPASPEVSLLVLSELLGCPIENLEFSNWYLKEKGYIKITESADFSVTIAGVDYVENELLRKDDQSHILSLPEGRSSEHR